MSLMPITYQIQFTDIESFSQTQMPTTHSPGKLKITIEGGVISVNCTPEYLKNFLRADNLSDRLLVSSLIQGAYLLLCNRVPLRTEVEELIQTVVGFSVVARFLQMTPSQSQQDLIYDATVLPSPQLMMPEDQGWSRFNLARQAGYE